MVQDLGLGHSQDPDLVLGQPPGAEGDLVIALVRAIVLEEENDHAVNLPKGHSMSRT